VRLLCKFLLGRAVRFDATAPEAGWRKHVVSAAPLSKQLFSPCAGSYSNDLWEFDTTAPEAGWRKLEGVEGEAPGPRGWFQVRTMHCVHALEGQKLNAVSVQG